MKTLFTLIAVLIAITTNATIHVTYVYDDVTYTPNERSYDLDLDGDDDFSFTFLSVYHIFEVHCSKSTSKYAATGTSGSDPKAYSEGAGLGTYHWSGGTGTLADEDGNGNFADANKYLMVKFSDGANTYYGWLLVGYFTSSTYPHVLNYAYNDIPGAAIEAGQLESGVGIEEFNKATFSLSQINQHSIAFKDCNEYDKVSVYSTEGKLLAEIKNPTPLETYSLNQNDKVMLVAFFRRDQLLFTSKYLIQ